MKPFDYYLLRCPVLPFNKWNDPSFVDTLLQDPFLSEAIYTASPELHEQLLASRHSNNEKSKNKLTLSLFKYWLRMCTRCTPFGLFAGCSTGIVADSTSVTLQEKETHRRLTRLDMDYLTGLVNGLMKIPEVVHAVKFYPNNSIYRVSSDQLRYVSFQLNNMARAYHLDMIETNELIDGILEMAAQGVTLQQLAEAAADPAYTEEEVMEFLEELVAAQLLVPDLEPAITGNSPIEQLSKAVKNYQLPAAITDPLEALRRLLHTNETGIEKYQQSAHYLSHFVKVDSTKNLLQTDLFLNTGSNQLKKQVIEDIVSNVYNLFALCGSNRSTGLDRFRDVFRERYEDREVPLAIALDAEMGIGYAEYSNTNADDVPLIKGMPLRTSRPDVTISWTPMQQFALDKYVECLQSGFPTIEITDKDLEKFKRQNHLQHPAGAYIMGNILAGSFQDIDNNNYTFNLLSFGAPAAGTTMGRFCYGDEKLREHMEATCRQEQALYKDVLLAEIIHLPESRVGNIILRPVFREYEMVYLGRSGATADQQITLDDLMVSVRNNQVVLRSKKFNKRVIPRLTNAHNFMLNTVALYRFLCDLQYQSNIAGIYWDWGVLGSNTWWPRVMYKNIIVEKAKWNISTDELGEGKPVADEPTLEKLLNVLRNRKIPDEVVLTEGDNELYINIHHPNGPKLLLQKLLKYKRILLTEFLFTNNNLFVEGKAGKYCSEVIIPCTNPLFDHAKQEPGFSVSTTTASPQRKFMPFHSWAYLKIYCGTNTAEKLLKEVIKPFTEEVMVAQQATKWFFIRYLDPQHHLRIRFYQQEDPQLNHPILQELIRRLDHYTKHEAVNKIVMDTYQREIERYGADTMELSESFFYYDSVAVLEMVHHLEGSREEDRWLWGLRSIQHLFNDFGLDLESKYQLIDSIAQGYFTEANGKEALSKYINDKYRSNTAAIAAILKHDAGLQSHPVELALQRRTAGIVQILRENQLLFAETTPAAIGNELLPSFIHMHLNRLLVSNQRRQEMVLCHFLAKHYRSQLALQRSANKQQQSQQVVSV